MTVPTRRAMLGSITATPLLAVPATAAPARVSGDLATLFAADRAAEARLNVFHADVYVPLRDASRSPNDHLRAAAARSNELGDAWADAQAAIVAHPATTFADLLAKLDFMKARSIEWDEQSGAAIEADIRHLAQQERS